MQNLWKSLKFCTRTLRELVGSGLVDNDEERYRFAFDVPAFLEESAGLVVVAPV